MASPRFPDVSCTRSKSHYVLLGFRALVGTRFAYALWGNTDRPALSVALQDARRQ